MFRSFTRSLSLALVLAVASISSQAQVAWGGRDIEAPQVRQVASVAQGTVLEVVVAKAHDRSSDAQRGVGGALGALLGAAAAHREGGGAQAAAALIGGLAGEHVARRAGHTVVPSQEVIVQLNDGRAISVVQAVDEAGFFEPGQSVFVVGLNQTYDSYGRLSPVRVIARRSVTQ